MKTIELAKKKDAIVIGPNTPGIIIPGVMKIGIMPASPFKPGRIAVLSRSGTLMYEVSYNLSLANFGQSVCLGIGGDPINGTPVIDAFERIRNGANIDGVVVVGEIGGDAEEMLAQHIIDTKFDKPVVAYIAGRAAPKEKRMGHAGAIIYGNYGSAESKVSMYAKANVPVAKRPAEVSMLLAGKLDIKGRIK
jgi:succinyl-CoA synthetase alpha subunit